MQLNSLFVHDVRAHAAATAAAKANDAGLVTLAQDVRALGQAWHVPSPPAITLRELAQRYADAAGKPAVKLIQSRRQDRDMREPLTVSVVLLRSA